MKIDEIAGESLGHKAYGILKERIVTLFYPPGTRLNISNLAKDLGISTVPLRDACHRLQADYLVDFEPRIGYSVVNLSPDEISDLFDLRILYEMYAFSHRQGETPLVVLHELRQATADMANETDNDELVRRFYPSDEHLHRDIIVGQCSNRLIREAYERINARIRLAKHLTNAISEHDIAEHLLIIDEMIRGDFAKAAKALEDHLKSAKEIKLDTLRGLPGRNSTRP